MAYIASTFAFGSGSRGGFSGQLQRVSLAFATKRIHFPPSTAAVEKRPSVRSYLSRLYMVGGHTANIVVDEELRALRQGIPSPPAPAVTVGAGSTPQVVYLRFYDELTGESSSIGPGTSVTGNTTRVYTSLPTSVAGEGITVDGTVSIASGVIIGTTHATNFGGLRPGDRVAVSSALTRWAQVRSVLTQSHMTIDDTGMAGTNVSLVVRPVSRVSHVESWVSVNGALPRFSARVRLGTTGFTESVATLALGEAIIDTYQPMPTGSMSVIYNDRQLVSGVPGQLDRVFLSEIGFPERYAGLNFRTQFGEPIVGLLCYRDYVMMLCADSSYRLQGYTEDDYVRDVIEPGIGALGHLGNRVVDGFAIIPSRTGFRLFSGAYNAAMPTRRKEWTEDYRLNALAFEGGMGAVNPIDEVYMFLPDANRISTQSSEIDPTVFECSNVGESSLASISSPKLYLESGDAKNIGLYWYDRDQAPTLRLAAYETVEADHDTAVGAFGDGYLYIVGVTATLIKLKRMTRGGTPTTIGSIAHGLSGLPENIYATDIEKYGSDIYFVVRNSSGVAVVKTYKWDGTAITVDDPSVPSSAEISNLETLGSDLYLINGEANIRRKTGGSWTSVATGLPVVNVRGASVFNNKVYYSQQTFIRSVAGTTVTAEHDVVDIFGGGGQVYNLTTFNGALYYIWIAINSGIWIGKYDGVTWNNNFKSFGDNNTLPHFGPSFFGEIDGRLCMTAEYGPAAASPPCVFIIVSSVGPDVSGEWVISSPLYKHADHLITPSGAKSAAHGAYF